MFQFSLIIQNKLYMPLKVNKKYKQQNILELLRKLLFQTEQFERA